MLLSASVKRYGLLNPVQALRNWLYSHGPRSCRALSHRCLAMSTAAAAAAASPPKEGEAAAAAAAAAANTRRRLWCGEHCWRGSSSSSSSVARRSSCAHRRSGAGVAEIELGLQLAEQRCVAGDGARAREQGFRAQHL
eukprot:TRINITY_DN5683_c3_g1_i3.p1 TRINITY_DN5683_c3_g1~~TRINITY_DN5683_c3_g1_i3.p1  ORF type:complete len:138 (-),score=50.95 TRINITY_DN5683_c3_g1_i3:501-914(-)